ncbi:MAG: CDGSH iron-sulfur domain-containing protein [Flavobacteriales bacterium]|nr:CDGSH iron-sulfur domain-containing protein [Flavobacteriales bacterium]
MNEPKLIKSLKLELEPGTHYWCSCKDKPETVICTPEHNDCDPLEFKIEEKRLRSYCTCKMTKTPPFCDGYHKIINLENGFPPPEPKIV